MVQTVQPVSPPAAHAPAAIEIRSLTLAYDRRVVLSRASFEVPSGSLAAVVGPAGAGKSSLLHCLAGGLRPRSGEVRVLGGDPRGTRMRVAYVPGSDLVDWQFPISLAEVVALGRRGRQGILARSRAGDRGVALECLGRVGLRALADRRIARLDPGQRRRALLARALAQKPELLLVDEPGLQAEPTLAGDFFEALDLCRAPGRTLLVATRELADAVRRYEWLTLVNGRVVAHGRPTEVLGVENLRATYGETTVAVHVPATSFGVDR